MTGGSRAQQLTDCVGVRKTLFVRCLGIRGNLWHAYCSQDGCTSAEDVVYEPWFDDQRENRGKSVTAVPQKLPGSYRWDRRATASLQASGSTVPQRVHRLEFCDVPREAPYVLQGLWLNCNRYNSDLQVSCLRGGRLVLLWFNASWAYVLWTDKFLMKPACDES